ncbi:AAA family ATPase [Burkholderia cenocepacia]|uniref:SbcC/MukB-like Walker B domain-containing protein n=1 Tax=Burkholderia cenocepacia TaxID=95486 RepID=UPI001B933780|nr:SbcC/MukB-like Walker B domain-containing protein [Burkholderia cenocepacia]MBR8380491.1 AAA family ATPase [Burkholderia cenocepacia]MBR8415061.1 AAA family ATPase [Burkholderia cenocepacia]
MTMSLHAVHVVQFFMFDARTIEISNISGIFGPNGSGKSSLVDAVQIAMLGANQRLAALNAQADESNKTTRSIRGYCLGQYGETAEQRVRDHATTYITLVWRDDVARTSVSMGVCIYASSDTEEHEVRGLYLVPGIELSLGDHLSLEEGVQRPRDWKTFRADLIRRAKAASDDEILYTTSKSYIRAVLTRLRGNGGIPDHEAFQRAFRFALRMRFDKTVDQLVRDEVLEARPTKIKRFREITDTFLKLKLLVEKVSAQIDAGEAILGPLDKAEEQGQQAAAWHVLRQDAETEQAQDVANHARAVAREALDALETLQAELAEQQRTVEEAVRVRLEAIEQRDAHTAHQHHGVLKSAVDTNEGTSRAHLARVSSLLTDIARALQNASRCAHLTSLAPALQHECGALVGVGDQIALDMDIESIAVHLKSALQVARTAWDVLIQNGRDLSAEIDELKSTKLGLETDLERAKEGRVQLTERVRRLRSALLEHGINSTPVCDVIRVTDSAWERVVESYLGLSNLEALVVDEQHEEKAFELYRSMSGRGAVYGAKIVMSSRFSTPKPAGVGTVAEVIDGDLPVAVAFVQNLFRDIQRVSTSGDALAGGRTLTADGMLTGKGTMERLAPLSERRMGVRGEEQKAGIELALRDCQAHLTRKLGELSSLDGFERMLREIPTETRAIKEIRDGCADARKFQDTADRYAAQLRELSDDEYLALCERVKRCEDEERQSRATEKELVSKEGAAGQAALHLDREAKKAEAAADELKIKLRQVRESASFDSAYIADQWDRLLERFSTNNYAELIEHCRGRAKNLEIRQQSEINRGMAALGKFLGDYQEQLDERTGTDWQLARAWVKTRVDHLRGTQLVERQAEMDEAYRASQETFRTDVAVELANNLAWLEDTITRLNSVLKTSPVFSNDERYQFIYVARSENQKLLNFIKDIAAYGPNDTLLGSAGEIPEQFKTLLEEKSAPGAGSVRTALDDYREFFTFDIEIQREDPETKRSKTIGHLSKRLGPGSGGEHRAPLYVIAGAALASAYRLSRAHSNGIRLILLDEAFHRMDQTNITATMRYFEDLGLQVLLASPGENLGILTAFLHRYYDIVRDPENNVVMLTGHNVNEEARQLMRSDQIEFHPELLEAEIARIRTERSTAASLISAK